MLTIVRGLWLAVLVLLTYSASAADGKPDPLTVEISDNPAGPVYLSAQSSDRPNPDRLLIVDYRSTPAVVDPKLTIKPSGAAVALKKEATCPTGASACFGVTYPTTKGRFELEVTIDLNGTPAQDSMPNLQLAGAPGAADPKPEADREKVECETAKPDDVCSYNSSKPDAFYERAIKLLFKGEQDVIKEYASPPRNVYLRRKDRAVLFYTSKGEPLYPLPQVDENDTVTVVVVPTDGSVIRNVRISSCSARPAFRIKKGGSRLESLSSDAEATQVKMVTATSCSADSDIKVAVLTSEAGDAGTVIPNEIVIETLPLYNVILSLGLVYDFSLQIDWTTRTAKGATVPHIVEDEHVAGLQEPILLVGYHWCAVDSERPREWCDFAPAPFIGFSFTEPLSHLYAGLIFEPYPNFGIVLGWHAFKKQTVAAGYAAGDSYASGPVPVDERWSLEARNVTLGLSVDSAVLVDVLNSVKGTP